MKTNDKYGFNTKAGVNIRNIKWKMILLVLKSSFMYTRWLSHKRQLFIISIGDSYDNGRTGKHMTL